MFNKKIKTMSKKISINPKTFQYLKLTCNLELILNLRFKAHRNKNLNRYKYWTHNVIFVMLKII